MAPSFLCPTNAKEQFSQAMASQEHLGLVGSQVIHVNQHPGKIQLYGIMQTVLLTSP